MSESWYSRNKEKAKAQARAYQAAHKEKYKEYLRNYYQTHKPQMKQNYDRFIQRKRAAAASAPPPTPEPQPLLPITPLQPSDPPIVIQRGSFLVAFD